MALVFNNSTTTAAINRSLTTFQCHPFTHQDHHYPYPLAIVFLLVIAIVALIGNTLVVLVISKVRQMHTFMNWMLFNLAVADLSAAVAIICVDITQEVYKKWVFGKILCRFLFPVRCVTMFTSIFTLVCLGISRCWAIKYPFRRQPSAKFAKVLICCIWMFSLTLAVPYMINLQYHDGEEQCYEIWSLSTRKLYTVLTFVFTYLIPVVVITTTYAQIVGERIIKRCSWMNTSVNKEQQRENRTLIKLSMVISSAFSCCVLPYQVVWILFDFNETFQCFYYLSDVIMASFLLLYLGSALNPVIYNIFSESFRGGVSELWTNVRAYVRGHDKRKISAWEGSGQNRTEASSD